MRNIIRSNIKRKRDKFYIINSIDTQIFFKKEKIKPCAMKTHIHISYKVKKVSGKK